jgi:hypothetical protein
MLSEVVNNSFQLPYTGGNCMVKYYTKQSYQQANNMIHSISRITELTVFELKLLKHILEKEASFLEKHSPTAAGVTHVAI